MNDKIITGDISFISFIYYFSPLYIISLRFCSQAHVVSAFEQSLSNMTQRLQQLTATAEKKVSKFFSNQKLDYSEAEKIQYIIVTNEKQYHI